MPPALAAILLFMFVVGTVVEAKSHETGVLQARQHEMNPSMRGAHSIQNEHRALAAGSAEHMSTADRADTDAAADGDGTRRTKSNLNVRRLEVYANAHRKGKETPANTSGSKLETVDQSRKQPQRESAAREGHRFARTTVKVNQSTRVQSSPIAWDVVYQKGTFGDKNVGMNAFDKTLEDSLFQIARRNGLRGQPKEIYYKRLTNPKVIRGARKWISEPRSPVPSTFTLATEILWPKHLATNHTWKLFPRGGTLNKIRKAILIATIRQLWKSFERLRRVKLSWLLAIYSVALQNMFQNTWTANDPTARVLDGTMWKLVKRTENRKI